MKLTASVIGSNNLPDGQYTGVIKTAGVSNGASGERVWVSVCVTGGASHIGAYQLESWPTDKSQQAYNGLTRLVETTLGRGTVLEDTDQLLGATIAFVMKDGRLFVSHQRGEAKAAAAEQPAPDAPVTE